MGLNSVCLVACCTLFVTRAQQSVEQIIQHSNEVRAQAIEKLKTGIVRIKADSETGSGIVISASPNRILILTALHVVKNTNNVSVVFYSNRATPAPARKLDKHSAGLDLAVLEVTAGPNIRLPQDIMQYHFALASTMQQGEHIWTANGEWIPVPNSITRLNHEADTQRFEYTSVSVGEGFSGGPIFDDYANVIGMHDALNAEGNYAVGIKIDAALQTLEALDYNVPKAGPISVNLGVAGQTNPNQTNRPCEKGCEVKIADLKMVQNYHDKREMSGRIIDVTERVYELPADWPALHFLHRITTVVTYAASNSRIHPTRTPMQQPDQFMLAGTDRQGDTECMLLVIGTYSPKSPCRAGSDLYNYKLYGPPGGDPVSIQVSPYR